MSRPRAGRQERRRGWMCAANKVLHHVLIVVGIFSHVVVPLKGDCPERCSCKWISGKKTGSCISADYTRIPDFTDDFQVIDLKYNRFQYLYDDTFSSVGLVNLQKVLMKNVTMKEIHRDAFNGLSLLVEVDLSDNSIAVVPKGAFAHNQRLRILTLSGNPLKILRNEQFPHLPHLRILNLQNCLLHTIDIDAFIHLINLEHLKLNSNRLESLHREVFNPMERLKSLDLDDNPWRCDCELTSLRQWYLGNNIFSTPLVCREPPKLRGEPWEEVLGSEFSCSPEVYVLEPLVTNADLGDNLTLHCHVSGLPEPRAIWLYNGDEISLGNDSLFDDRYLFQVNYEDERNKWLNVTVLNVSDSGAFTCEANNYLGEATQNVTVVLTQLYSTTYVKKTNVLYLFTALLLSGLVTVIVITCIVACGCMSYNRKQRQKHRRLEQETRGMKGYYEQQRQLLEVTVPERKSSLGSSVDMPKPPERHKGLTPVAPPEAPNGSYPPPPPEFSNTLPTQSGNNLGNIFISVSLSPDPSVTIERFPDLLDTSRTSSSMGRSNLRKSISSSTIPRRLAMREVDARMYDNMGRRVTAGGSSTLSLCRDRVPTPPPPPPPPPPPHQSSNKLDFDYVPL